jgi:hypothetical protein
MIAQKKKKCSEKRPVMNDSPKINGPTKETNNPERNRNSNTHITT